MPINTSPSDLQLIPEQLEVHITSHWELEILSISKFLSRSASLPPYQHDGHHKEEVDLPTWVWKPSEDLWRGFHRRPLGSLVLWLCFWHLWTTLRQRTLWWSDSILAAGKSADQNHTWGLDRHFIIIIKLHLHVTKPSTACVNSVFGNLLQKATVAAASPSLVSDRSVDTTMEWLCRKHKSPLFRCLHCCQSVEEGLLCQLC